MQYHNTKAAQTRLEVEENYRANLAALMKDLEDLIKILDNAEYQAPQLSTLIMSGRALVGSAQRFPRRELRAMRYQ